MASGKKPAATRFMLWAAVVAGVSAVPLGVFVWMSIAHAELGEAVSAIVVVGAIAAAAIPLAALIFSKRVRFNTIGVRLRMALVLMAILPALTINLGSGVLGYVNGRQQAISRLESVVALKELELVTWSQSLQNVLLSALTEEYATERASVLLDLATNQNYSDLYSQAMRVRLQFLLDEFPDMQELMLLDRSGQIILSTEAEHQGRGFGDRAAIEGGLAGAVLRIPFEPPAEGLWPDGLWAFAARPVRNQKGEVLGIIAARVAARRLAEILGDRTGLGETGKLLLADSKGTLLLAQETLSAVSAGPGQTVELQLPARVGQPGLYRDHREIRVVGFYRPIDRLDLMLAAEQDLSEALGAVYATLALNVGISLLAVLLASVAAIMLSKTITHPLVELADTATRISEGDLGRTAPVQRDDEVGTLAVAFNAMTAQLRDLIINLEHRVAERTQTLQDAMRAERRRALQLETSASVSREITSILDTDELLNRVVGLIQRTFGYYHVNIYLVEEDELVLRASTAEAYPMLRRAPLDIVSLNTEIVRSNGAVLVNDVQQDSRYLLDENLPETRSELVVPLRVGDEVIGTLDVLGKEICAFTEEDSVVFQSVADQVAIAIENARLYERSQELAVVEERNRLARDLHDSVIQSLYSLNLLAAGWQRLFSAGERDQIEEHLDRVGQITRQALREMRLLVQELRPPALEEEGLLGALYQRLGAVESRAGIEARLVAEELIELPGDIEAELWWIARESLNNTLKHSGASQVTIRIHLDDGYVVLEVMDDGSGFDAGSATCQGGVGLGSMCERAERLGGELTIVTSPGRGTTVRASVPASASSEDPA